MNGHHRTLLDYLDEAPVGTAPIGHLMAGGQDVKRRKQRAFVAGAAAVTALVVGGRALSLQGIPGSSDDRDSNDPPIAESTAPDLTGSPSARRVTLRLAATSGWPVFRPTDCGQWSPSGQDSVVALNTLADDCIAKASRNATTVFMAPYGNPLFSERWADVTAQWRRVDGADVRRLSAGSLAEMSSRVVDAIVCKACDQVIVVVGPHPGIVRGLLESLGTG